MEPLVSICCVTYNHAATLAQALDGFLMQRSVRVEVLVHDDASTDGTQALLQSYAARYPDLIKPLYETENQYRKGVAMDATFNFPRATGEYIALCEGDDAWTDPDKLARQIECLRAHPGATFCFTNATVRDVSGRAPDRSFLPYYPEEAAWLAADTAVYHLGRLTHLTFIPTASFVFPRAALEAIPPAMLTAPCPYGDLRLKLMLTAVGFAVYLSADTCLYRLNTAGSAMARWGAEPAARTRERCAQTLRMLADVQTLCGERCQAELQRLRDAQLRVLLYAAPTRALLRQPEARRVYRALPLPRRLLCRLKACLPDDALRTLRARLRRAPRA